MSWGKIYCDTNWGENKYRTAGSIINEATPDCFQFPEFVSFKDHVRSEGATYEKMQCGIDILLFLGRSISITPQSPDNPTFSGILDTYTGATAGYSTRRLTNTYTGGLIRVRRSSDDAEQDIGYDANGEDLDTFGLLAFVNEDVNQYTSDFSSTEDLGETNGTGAAAQSIGGVDDAYKFTTITGTGQMFAGLEPFSGKGGGNEFRVQADVYLPSTNAEIDKVRIFTGYGAETFAEVTTTDSWVSVDQTLTITSGEVLRFQAYDGTDVTPTTTEANVFYLKNIVVTQTTADGFVTTWYDQTGNGNHATNSTASEQSKIVDGGSIIYEGATISRPALDFDGVDDYFTLGGTNDAGMLGDISVFSVNKNSISGNSVVVSTGTMVSSYAPNMQWGITGGVGGYTGTTSDGTTRINESISTSDYGSQMLVSMINDEDGNLQVFADGVGSTGQTAVAPMNDANFALEVGRDSGGQRYYFDGTQQELILFASDQSTNRTGIEGNIDNYFRITS